MLVAHGSERGGSAEMASRIAASLREDWLEVDVRPARDVHDLRPYAAVVLGGALYAMHWHADARRFVLRHHRALRQREVHFFSSGPLDDSASRGAIPPTPQVAELMAYVGARAHVTFGGRLAKDARGFPASAMAKTRAGDWRNYPRVDAWAHALATTLSAPPTPHVAPQELPSRAAALVLCLFAGISAVFGGAVLVASPSGGILNMPVTMLAHSPFRDFLGPGVLLFALVGVLSLYAGWQIAVRGPYAPLWSFAAGASMTIWIVTEALMLRGVHWLQLGYLVVGLATIYVSMRGVRRLMATFATMRKKTVAAPVAKAA